MVINAVAPNSQGNRCEELEHYQEWHAAIAVLDRTIPWGVAVGKCTTGQGRRIRACDHVPA